MKRVFLFLINLWLLGFLPLLTSAQMITGVWKGKIHREKVEVKIIQDGDSLRGTSYYYESPTQYRRYAIRGYFNSENNEAVWWDDQLIEEKSGKINLNLPGRNAMLSSADFNCPGGGRMLLDGKSEKKENGRGGGDLHLEKAADPDFPDEWDFVIDNYLVGGNDPYIIDSISEIAMVPVERVDYPQPSAPRNPSPPVIVPRVEPKKPQIEIAKAPPKPVIVNPEPAKPLTIEEKFVTRKKTLVTEIPLSGDSIELRFYDNAEIDGDSISLFMNDKLIFQHIRLTGNAYTIYIPVHELNETNELIMVAENLGSIPPNTSYMVAIVGENRYEARLESTEGSSAMVRFVKKAETVK